MAKELGPSSRYYTTALDCIYSAFPSMKRDSYNIIEVKWLTEEQSELAGFAYCLSSFNGIYFVSCAVDTGNGTAMKCPGYVGLEENCRQYMEQISNHVTRE